MAAFAGLRRGMFMRSIIGVAICFCLGSSAFAASDSLLAKPAPPAKSLPPVKATPRAGAANPCAAYGPRFVRVAGTDTCMKLGGAASVEAGSSFGR
jgi:hypothetical protein